MAKMWPKRLPFEVRNNELRSAECKVFDCLETNLEDSFVVFYSRPWLGLRADGSEIDGECDFLIAHADRGILAIEVKGGRISYDPETDSWMSRDRGGFRHPIKDPVAQARQSKHNLLQKLRDSQDWHSRFITAKHGVIFPDCEKATGNLGADRPLDIFCFRNDFEHHLSAWVKSRLRSSEQAGAGEKPLGADGIRALEKLLAAPFTLQVPLGHYLADDERTLSIQTTEQFHILECLEDITRAAISGGAGTGKTVLAAEKAVRSAAAGLRTVFICFNRPLAEHVTRQLSGFSNVSVTSFHALCKRLIDLAGLSVPSGIPESRLLRDTYPDLMIQALDVKPDERVDCVIVDEGQDFQPHWWIAIDALLDPHGPGRLYVFYDSNQRIYGDTLNIPRDVNLVPIRLTYNLRNTRRIYDVVRPHYRGFSIHPVGPDGAAVEWIDAETIEDQRNRIVRLVRRLTGPERIAPEDVAVLVSRKEVIPKIAPAGRVSGFPVSGCDLESAGSVIVDTVRRFKGLERSVVILVVDSELVDDGELAYVALSRPRTLLVLLGPPSLLHVLKEPHESRT